LRMFFKMIVLLMVFDIYIKFFFSFWFLENLVD